MRWKETLRRLFSFSNRRQCLWILCRTSIIFTFFTDVKSKSFTSNNWIWSRANTATLHIEATLKNSCLGFVFCEFTVCCYKFFLSDVSLRPVVAAGRRWSQNPDAQTVYHHRRRAGDHQGERTPANTHILCLRLTLNKKQRGQMSVTGH